LGHAGKTDGNDPNGTAFLQYHMFPNSRLINSNFRTKNYHYLYPQNKNKKSSFMAGILIQAPFITKKWMYIIKNGQRPRGLEQEGFKGQKFLAG